jgi:hypothetical protein
VRRLKGAEDHPAILHIGYVRTATTTHQRQVFSKHRDIAYLGKPYPAAVIKDIVYQFVSADSAIFDRAATRAALEAVLADRVVPNGRVVAISEEAILSPYTVDTRVLCRRLIALFGDPKIVITIRRQDELLVSWLFHVVKKPYARPLEVTLDLLESESHASTSLLHYLDYAAIIQVFVEELGRDNVLILPYELFRSDKTEYAAVLSTFMGIDSAETQRLLADSAVSNQRQGKAKVAYFDFKSRYLPPGVMMPWLESRLKKLFARAGLNADHVSKIAARAQALCAERYAQSNRVLAELYGLDLRSYGYPGL